MDGLLTIYQTLLELVAEWRYLLPEGEDAMVQQHLDQATESIVSAVGELRAAIQHLGIDVDLDWEARNVDAARESGIEIFPE